MITPDEIKAKAERKYLAVLQSLLSGEPFARLIIAGDKTYTKSSLNDFEKEMLLLISQSKAKKGYGYALDYQKIKTKYLGTQDLPTTIYFDTEKDLFRFLGKEKEVQNCKIDYEKIIAILPQLQGWATQNPAKIIKSQGNWDGILKVCQYFLQNPKPNLYIRELPVQVHTKFIERHQTILKELLEILIPDAIHPQETTFEKRHYLKYSEPQIRFKILDPDIANRFFSGIDDLAIPVSQFEKLRLPLQKVIVVENKTTLHTTLTLPSMTQTIAIFGSGYTVSSLKNVPWFAGTPLLYWGDLDAQGFEILSQFRSYHPHTQSVLMDKITFEKFFENDLGTPTKVTSLLHLNDAELELFHLLSTNNWRLEQEKVPFLYTKECFEGYK